MAVALQCRARGFGPFRVQVDAGDPGAAARITMRQRETEAAAGSGNEDATSFHGHAGGSEAKIATA